MAKEKQNLLKEEELSGEQPPEEPGRGATAVRAEAQEPSSRVGSVKELDKDLLEARAKIRREADVRRLVEQKGLQREEAVKLANMTPEERERKREEEMLAGSLEWEPPDVIDAMAIDHGEMIGRALKTCAAFPIDIVRVERSATNEVYFARIRNRETRQEQEVSISHEAFLREQEQNPRGLGKWMRGVANAAFGRPYQG